MREMRFGFFANQSRAVPATSAQIESQSSAIATKIAPSMPSCSGIPSMADRLDAEEHQVQRAGDLDRGKHDQRLLDEHAHAARGRGDHGAKVT
jgi:hypothetical protein